MKRKTNSQTGSRHRVRPTSRPSGGNSFSTALWIIGGAGIGAGLMYLLDPEAGARRRHAVIDTAGGAAGAAGETLSSAWETIAENARHIGSHVADRTAQGLDEGSRNGRRLLGRVGSAANDAAEQASETASSWLDSARAMLAPAALMSSARSLLPRQKRVDPMITVLTAAGCLAAGLGTMYLLDPERGRSRRAHLRDKSGHVIHEIGDFVQRTGRHVRNRAVGQYHKARAMIMPGEEVNDMQLAERVRAALGHTGVGAGSVAITAHDGRITLTGQCAVGDEDEIVRTARKVRGVWNVLNQLEAQDRAAATNRSM